MFPNTRGMKTTIHIQRWGDGPEDKGEEEDRGSSENRKRDMDIILWSKFTKVKDLSHNVHSQILKSSPVTNLKSDFLSSLGVVQV